jgi:peptide/nickel transport system permease protein
MLGPVTLDRRSRTWRVLRADRFFWLGAGIVLVMLGLAILAPVLAPHDPIHQFREEGLASTGDPLGPTAMFPLGTDRTGRDYLSRLLFGARTSLGIALIANLIATVVGVAVGSVAAFWPVARLRVPGTRRHLPIPLGSILMRLTDLALSFPVLLLAIALAAVLRPSIPLIVVIIAAVSWSGVSRIIYGRVLVLREAAFIEAARAQGISGRRLLRIQVLPHLAPLAVVYGALGVASAVLFEATLSYLGAGVPAPTPAWGGMIADHISWYATDPRLVLLPGLAIMLTVVGFTLLGDALRDALDPRAQSRIAR